MTYRGFGIKIARGVQAVLNIIESRCDRGQSHVKNVHNTGLPHNNQEDKYPTDLASNPLMIKAHNLAMSNGWIVQEYVQYPLLVSGRKFDIRCYVLLMNSVKDGNHFEAYWFKGGYIRTSGKKHSLSKLNDRETRLTNDGVQKHSKFYGNHEAGNKLSLTQWQENIEANYPDAPQDVVESVILPKIKEIAKISLEAALYKGLVSTKIRRSFELVGYDFMIDSNFNPTLVEINVNPCLEFVCPLLEDLITKLISNMYSAVIDRWFQPPSEVSRTKYAQQTIEKIEAEPKLFEILLKKTVK